MSPAFTPYTEAQKQTLQALVTGSGQAIQQVSMLLNFFLSPLTLEKCFVPVKFFKNKSHICN
jgi:hypothetical protein